MLIYKERCVDCFQSTVSCQTCTFINSPQLTFAEDSSIGHWLLVTGHSKLVAGRWFLVAGSWSLVAGKSVVEGGGCQEFRIPHSYFLSSDLCILTSYGLNLVH